MGTVEIEVGDDVVFAYYVPADAGPNVGGYLAKVFAGGQFLSVGYADLRALGTGHHQIAMDERAQLESGPEPEYESEWRQRFEEFQFTLFMHRVGACVALDVLSAASEVVRLEIAEQERAEKGAAADRGDAD
jgi:hypothetical protein